MTGRIARLAAHAREAHAREGLPLIAAACAFAATAWICGAQIVRLSGYPAFWTEGRGSIAEFEHEDRQAWKARAEAIAITALVDKPGPWSGYMESPGVWAVAKGGAVRVVPNPPGLDKFRASPGPYAAMYVRDGGPMIEIGSPHRICHALLGEGGLSDFATGPLEYRLTDDGPWERYGNRFPCSGLSATGSPVWIRPAAARE